MGVSGTLPLVIDWDSEIDLTQKRQTPILILHGSDDTSLPTAYSQTTYDQLDTYSMDWTFEEIDGMGHGANEDGLTKMEEFFTTYMT